MKKTYRSIIVNNRRFNWRTVRGNTDSLILRVWIDGEKRMPWIEISYPYKDPWLYISEEVAKYAGNVEFDETIFEGITPAKVAQIISHAIKELEIPKDVDVTHGAEWDKTLETLSFTR